MGIYRILSFDGGPGAITFLQCLIRLETDRPGFIQSTNMFVGSSAGSWVAGYLAWNMSQVDNKTITGLQLLENAYTFAEQAFNKMMPANLPAAYLSFIEGKGPLTNYDAVETYMQEPDVYGNATLGQVQGVRRLVINAARAEAPWAPMFYDSANASDASVFLYDATLSSASMPLLAPIRDGQVDGGMYCNDPSLMGLVQALKGATLVPAVPLADIRLLACGQDDGSSRLSDIFMPGRLAQGSSTSTSGDSVSLPGPTTPSGLLTGILDAVMGEGASGAPALGGTTTPPPAPSESSYVSDVRMQLACVCDVLDVAQKNLALPLPVQTSDNAYESATAGLAGEPEPSMPARGSAPAPAPNAAPVTPPATPPSIPPATPPATPRSTSPTTPPARPPATSPGGAIVIDDAFFRATRQLVDTLAKETRAQLMDLDELGSDLAKILERMVTRAKQLPTLSSEQAWGWPQWLAYPLNPIFIIQVLWNSQGRGTSALCSQLLGAQTLRLAPSGLLTTNSALALICIGQMEVVFGFGKDTAARWSSVLWQPLYQFKPGIAETRAWIDAQWPLTV